MCYGNFRRVCVMGLLIFGLICLPATVSQEAEVVAKIGMLMRLSEASGNAISPYWSRVASCAILAVHHINARNTEMVEGVQLPERFRVAYHLFNTHASPSIAVSRTNEMMQSFSPNALVGPVLSAAAGPVSLLSAIDKIPVMGFASTSPALSQKSTYKWFNRVIFSDRQLVNVIFQTCKQLDWMQVSVLYQDDIWGSGIAEAALAAADSVNISVASTHKFTSSDSRSIERAVHAARRSGARIFLFAALEEALGDLFFAAEDAGISTADGYAWVATGGINDPAGAIAQSSDPARLQRLTTGVLDVRADAVAEKTERFNRVLRSTPAESVFHPEMGDVEALRERLLMPVDSVCGYAYDATWAAALALSRVPWSGDAPVDGDDVLAELLRVEFSGATGHVALDPETGDRRAEGIAMVVESWQPLDEEAGGSVGSSPADLRIVAKVVATFDAEWRLYRVGEPYWAHGVRGWDAVPEDGVCGPGSAFNRSSRACTPCPAGFHSPAGQRCAVCPVGTHAAQAGSTVCSDCPRTEYANTTGLAACHPCPANHEIAAEHRVGTSADHCRCRPSFFFGCKWHGSTVAVWVTAAAMALVGTAAGSYYCRGGEDEDAEQRAVRRAVRKIRRMLHLRRKDGFLMPSERLPWFSALRFGEGSFLRLQYKHLESAARLYLLLDFDVEALNMLGLLLEFADHCAEDCPTHDVAERNQSLHSVDVDSRPGSPPPLYVRRECSSFSATGLLSPHPASPSFTPRRSSSRVGASDDAFDVSLREQGFAHETKQYKAFCRLILGVSRVLLDPAGVDPNLPTFTSKLQDGAFPGRALRGPRDAEERFLYFKTKVARLRMWQAPERFASLKRIAQEFMDRIRKQCDRLHTEMLRESRGQELARFTLFDVVSDPEVIARQDHASVRAVRLDDCAWEEVEVQRARQVQWRDDALPTSVPGSPVGNKSNLSARSSLPDISSPRSSLRGARSSLVARDLAAAFQRVSSPGRSSPLLAGLGLLRRESMGSSGKQIASQLLGGVGLSMTTNGPTDQLVVDERPFVEQLLLRAGLLDAGFQRQVRVVTGLKLLERRESSAWRPAVGLGAGRKTGRRKRGSRELPQSVMDEAAERRGGLVSEAMPRAKSLPWPPHEVSWTSREADADVTHAVGPEQDAGDGEAAAGEEDSELLGDVDVAARAEQALEFAADVEVHSAPIKTRERLLEKVHGYARQAEVSPRPASPSPHGSSSDRVPMVAGVLDPVRSAIVCSGPGQILEYATWFIRNGERHGLPVVKVKNKFSGDSSEYDGYRDLMLSVRYTGERGLSIIGEIQLHDKRMFNLKLKMHKLYKVKRATAANTI